MNDQESLSTSSSASSEPTALAVAPAKRPMVTLAAPIGGSMTAAPSRGAEWLEGIAEGWYNMPEDIKDAMILIQRSFPAGQGGSYYLTPPQALMVVRYCKSKGLEVHSDHWWFDPRNYRMGSTVSGLRAEARHAGLDLGPPQFEPLKRPWPTASPKLAGYTEDMGYRCKMRVGKGEDFASYEAWLSTSAQRDRDGNLKAGPWRDNPDHMLQVRAQSHTIKNALGSGISTMPEATDEEA